MDTALSPNYTDKFSRGMIFVAVAQIFNLMLSIYSFTQLGVKMNAESLMAATPNVLLTLLGCLSPLATILQIIGLVQLVQDSRHVGGRHRKFSVTAAVMFPVSLLIAIGSWASSLAFATQGSMPMYLLTLWAGALSSILTILALSLLFYAVSPRGVQVLLLAAVALVTIGTVGVTLMTTQNATIESYEVMGNSYFLPQFDLDRGQGIFPVLTLLALLGNAAFLVAAGWVVSLAWKEARELVPETVA